MGTAKDSVQRGRRPRKGLGELLPPGCSEKLFHDFMVSDAERGVINSALEKYRLGQSEPRGEKLLKPALRLMIPYRLRIEGIRN